MKRDLLASRCSACWRACRWLPSPRRGRHPNPLFADHAVLQQGTERADLGTADPGEAVTVAIAKQTVSTTAGADGRWPVRLAPLKAGGPNTLTICGTNKIVLADILVGEVWVAGGQSNMERQLGLRVGQQADRRLGEGGRRGRPPADPPLRRGAGEIADAARDGQRARGASARPRRSRTSRPSVTSSAGSRARAARPGRHHPQLLGRHAGGGVDQRGGAARAAGLRGHVGADQDADRGSGSRSTQVRSTARDLVHRQRHRFGGGRSVARSGAGHRAPGRR